MRCKGNFFNDRTCDMCSVVNNETYDNCKRMKHDAILRRLRIEKCPHRKLSYDKDSNSYFGCMLSTDAYGERYACENEHTDALCVMRNDKT